MQQHNKRTEDMMQHSIVSEDVSVDQLSDSFVNKYLATTESSDESDSEDELLTIVQPQDQDHNLIPIRQGSVHKHISVKQIPRNLYLSS